jgi:hypothetical protein
MILCGGDESIEGCVKLSPGDKTPNLNNLKGGHFISAHSSEVSVHHDGEGVAYQKTRATPITAARNRKRMPMLLSFILLHVS